MFRSMLSWVKDNTKNKFRTTSGGMTMSKVVVYVSEVNEPSKKVIELLDDYKITYEMKNVTKNKTYLQDLQSKGIYGTPATEIDGDIVLGFQKNKLKYALGVDDVSHYSSLFDGFNS